MNTQFSIRTLTAAVASACALLALPGQAAAQPIYSIAAVAGGNCGASSINDRSYIAGSCDGTAVVWKGGVATSLGRLTGGTFSEAHYVNSFGVAAGDGDTGNGRPQSWVSTPTGLLNIFPNNGGNTHALFIGDNGYIGGFYTKSLSGGTSSWKGAIWTPDPKDPRKYRELDLPVLAGGIDPKNSNSIPWAFNQAGQAAGWATNDVIGQHAAFWNSDAAHTVVDLGTIPGDWSSLAWGINDLGQVVGESHPPFANRAVLWNNDAAHTPAELPLLPGDNYGIANSINNLGHILGTSQSFDAATSTYGPAHTVLWRDGGVFDVQTVLDPAVAAEWTISSVSGINNLGQIIGMGRHNGQAVLFVMTPQ